MPERKGMLHSFRLEGCGFYDFVERKITFWKAQAKFYLSRDSIEARGGPRRANDAVIVLLTLVHFLLLPSRPLSLSFASF